MFQYFYLEKVENDLIKAEKTRPSFIGWKNSIILQREATEDVDNSFGQGIIVSVNQIRTWFSYFGINASLLLFVLAFLL